MGWKNHNTKALSLHECVYYGLSKSLKRQAGNGGGLVFHLTVSSASLEKFYLQVEDVKQGFGLRHHLSVTHISALILTQTRGFTPRPRWDEPQKGLAQPEGAFQMRGNTSHSKGDNGSPNISTLDETDPSVSTKSWVKTAHPHVLLHGLVPLGQNIPLLEF